LSGNLHAKQRVDYLADMLEEIGLERERIRMINISAGMGARFAELVNEFAAEIHELGPTGLKKKYHPKDLSLVGGLAPATSADDATASPADPDTMDAAENRG